MNPMLGTASPSPSPGKFRQFLRFAPLLAKWTLQIGVRRVARWAQQHGGTIRRCGVVGASIIIGYIAIRLGAACLESAALSGYLIAAAAMIGTTAAIVFSITIFLVQSVSDLYSSRHFHAYVSSWGELLPFVLIVLITVCFFGGGLDVGVHKYLGESERAIVLVSLTFIGAVFALIDAQFESVRKKVQPGSLIAFLRRRGLASAKHMERDAQQVAAMLRVPNAGLTEAQALAVAYRRVLGPVVTDLSNQVELLLDIALRLAERREIENAKVALSAAADLLCDYLRARRTSSVALPSPVMLVFESDSRPFLSAYLEQLNRAGAQFVRDGKDDLAAHTVWLYLQLAQAARDVEHIGPITENVILDQIISSLNSYATGNAGNTDEEVMFQATTVFGEIAELAAAAGLAETVITIQEHIATLAVMSYGYRTRVVASAATTALLKTLAAVFANENVERNYVVERALRGLGDVAFVIATLKEQGILAGEQWADTEGYLNLLATLNGIFAQYARLSDDAQKREYRRDVVDLIKALRAWLREESKRIAPDSPIAGSIGRLIQAITPVMVALLADGEFADVHHDLRDSLTRLSYSPYWFFANIAAFRSEPGSIDTLAEAVALTGVEGFEHLHDPELLKACIASLDSMATETLERATDRNGYNDARIFAKACLLGILALKAGWNNVVDELRGKAAAFQDAYAKRYWPNGEDASGLTAEERELAGAPFGNQVRREMEHFAASFEHDKWNGVHFANRAKDCMYALIDEGDIRAFIARVWPD